MHTVPYFSAIGRHALKIACLGTLMACSPTLAQDLVDPTIPAGSLTGDRVLVSPHWLDNFNTADTSWVSRMLAPYGVQVDVINPDNSAAKQLDTIQTAIASGNYKVIMWQPLDNETAGATIKKIQDAGIAQVVNFGAAGIDGLNYATTSVDWSASFTQAGKDAANYLKAHPELGPPRLAFINSLPANRICDARLQSLVDGLKSVLPDTQVVYNEGASTQEQSRSKFTDFINRAVPFNIFSGCGGAMALGGLAAMNAAGLGGATDKAPDKVYSISFDGSPPELAYLWSKDISLMRSGLFGPKDAAKAAVKMILEQLTGKLKYNQAEDTRATVTWLTPNCTKDRQIAVDQFAGVNGFAVPDCTFAYGGD